MASSHQTTLHSRQLLRNSLVDSQTFTFTIFSALGAIIGNYFWLEKVKRGQMTNDSTKEVLTPYVWNSQLFFFSTLNPKSWKSNTDMMAVMSICKYLSTQRWCCWWWRWWVTNCNLTQKTFGWPLSSLLSKRDYPVMTEVMTRGHLCWWQWQWFWSQKLKIWLLLILQHDLLTDKSQSFTKEDSHHHCLQIHYREKDSGTFWQVTWPVEPKARPLSGGQLKTGNQWSSWSLDSVWLDCSTFSFTVNRGRVCLVELLWSYCGA